MQILMHVRNQGEAMFILVNYGFENNIINTIKL